MLYKKIYFFKHFHMMTDVVQRQVSGRRSGSVIYTLYMAYGYKCERKSPPDNTNTKATHTFKLVTQIPYHKHILNAVHIYFQKIIFLILIS